MASTLSRVTTFVASNPILSSEVNAELNQIVNLLNSTSSSVKLAVKVSDAGDAPLEVNQLSTGPIQKWFQAGVLKATLTNDGSFSATGNLVLSNNAPQIGLVDVDNSKTMRIVLDNTAWSFINDTLATTPLFMNTTTDVFSFSQIPVGPASNPTTANQLARKQYVDDKTTWTKTWFYPVLPGAVESVESVGRLIIIGAARTITSITAVWAGGSDSGASNVFTIKRRNSAGTLQSDVGTVDVNTPAQDALQVSAVSVALADGDQIYPLFTTRNTASETLVSITVRGT